MIYKRHALLFALVLTFGLLATQTRAAMMIYGYTPDKHDRFYEEPDREFIGEGHDWSGVGAAWQQYEEEGETKYKVKWITMISPRYFLTANQSNVAAPDVGDVTFYEGNSLSGPSHTYGIDSIVATFGDLALGRLTEDIAPGIAYYPIMTFPVAGNYKDFIDLPFFAYGYGCLDYPSTTTNSDPRIGRNKIDDSYTISVGGKSTRVFIYNFAGPLGGGLGDDECQLRDGDIGAPSFVVCNGNLALVGIHGKIVTTGVDSFVSYYASNILSKSDATTISPLAGDANLDGIVGEDDAEAMAANWLRTSGALWAQGDFNGDGVINDKDAAIMAANWLRTANTSLAVPEPGFAVLCLSIIPFFSLGSFNSFRRLLAWFIVLPVLGLLASQAKADMTIYGYQQNLHYRYYDGSDKEFIGEGYDWSGVGRSTCGRWATMISPQYFLSAKHSHPSAYYNGEANTVTFYEGNSFADPSHSYEVDDWSYNWGDIYLGRLKQPIDENIAFYSVLDLPYPSSYINKTFFAYGKLHRVGRNKIDSCTKDVTNDGSTTKAMYFDYDGIISDSVGIDECLLEVGDSGGPSFIPFNGELSLVGIHWLKDGTKGSWDSFVPHYLDDILSYVNGGDANMDGIVDEIDAIILAANWNTTNATWSQGDFDGDGIVNSSDAARLSMNWLLSTTWSRSAEAAASNASFTAVPEPAALVMLVSSILFFITRAITKRRS